LSERRRGNGGGKKYHSTYCFHFNHLAFSVLSFEHALEASVGSLQLDPARRPEIPPRHFVFGDTQ
jgi:hypothetical protein